MKQPRLQGFPFQKGRELAAGALGLQDDHPGQTEADLQDGIGESRHLW